MRPFDLLNVESNVLDPVLDIEVEEPVRIIERTFGQYRNHVECEIIVLEKTYRAHCPVICSTSAACAAAGIMEICRTVDTEPDRCSGLGKKPHPTFVKEQSIGLKAVLKLHSDGAPLRHQRDCFLVPGEWNGERLTAMPCDL